MNKLYKKVLHRLYFFILIFFSLHPFLEPVYAADCTIMQTQLYVRKQPSIITDWIDGVAYRRYIVEAYPCADITIVNASRLDKNLSSLFVTAIFTDRSMKTKKADCGEKNLVPLEEYTCTVCFESEFPIFSLECRFR